MGVQTVITHAPIRLERGQSVSLDALAAGRPVVAEWEREARFLGGLSRGQRRGLDRNDLRSLSLVFRTLARRAAVERGTAQREAMVEAVAEARRSGAEATPVEYWLLVGGGDAWMDASVSEVQALQGQGFQPVLRVVEGR